MDSKYIIAIALAFWLFTRKAGASGSTGGTTYTVVSGDSLSAIAAAQWGSQYNSYAGAQLIADANPDYFGNGQSINLIQPGWVLNIPPAPQG